MQVMSEKSLFIFQDLYFYQQLTFYIDKNYNIINLLCKEMLPIQKNYEVSEKMTSALMRLDNLIQCKQIFFGYLIKMNTLEKTYAKRIWSSITEFEDKIVKLTFYSSQKVKRILNFTKIFKELSHHWQRISKLNIRNLQQIDNSQVQNLQKNVKQKANIFLQEIEKNVNQQKTYNQFYVGYKTMCSILKDNIDKFITYSDPLRFYNEKFTNQFLEKLKKQYDKCTNEESGQLKSQAQMCDLIRICIDQYRIQVKQAYVSVFEKILKSLYIGIKLIIDPNKDEAIQKEDFKLKKNQIEQKQFYKGQVQSLLGTQTYGNQDDDQTQNIKDDFKQLFQGSYVGKTQITADEKFFYDRCENLKIKKIKRSNEIISIQKLLITELKNQVASLRQFETESKRVQKQIFGSDGSQTFSKKFRTYFGKNFHQLYELCILISQKRKSSMEKIYKTIEKLQQKLQGPFKQKKQKLRFFQNRTNYILQNLKKIKEKAELSNFSSQQIVKEYKSNVSLTYEDFSRNYKELETNEQEMDHIFFKCLDEISNLILKEAITKNLSKILQKQKNRVQIFRQLVIPTQAQMNFYEDSKYEIFFSKQLEPNLSKSFRSEINVKEYEETKLTLSEKQHALNGMIQHRTTCCGVKSQVKMQNLCSSFECYLINKKKNKSKIYGLLNILSNGITFSQKSFNPFAKLLQIILPNRDIDSYKTEVVDETKVLTINTKKGAVYFWGDKVENIFNVMMEIFGVRHIEKESSDKRERSGSFSSSIMGSSNSQSFRLHFEKSTNSTTKRLQDRKNNTSAEQKPISKKSSQRPTQYTEKQLLQKIQLKLMSNKYLSENFIAIQKQLPIKDPSRFNYNYHQGIHKFLLKQKRRSELDEKVLSFDYSWKVSFPENSMLKSFTHYETVYVEIEKPLTKIKILHGVNDKNVSLAQKIFYQQISKMNKQLIEMIQQVTERQCEITIQPDLQQQGESQLNVDPEDITVNVITDGEGKLLGTGECFMRNPKFEKSYSGFTVLSGKS